MMIIGVYREPVFSPGRIDDDTRILEATLHELALSGYRVRAAHVEELSETMAGPDCVVTMAESPRALALFEAWERRGTRIINGVDPIRNCHRTSLLRLLSGAGLPIPRSWSVPVEELKGLLSFTHGRSYWLKRGDVHRVRPGDVARVTGRGETTRAIGHFRENGIRELVVQEHLEGDVVKFYGVADRSYFSAFLFSGNREEITGRVNGLQTIAHRAAEAVGLEVFGGDAVVGAKGQVSLIDLNCWPSFASCRRPAAKSIASYVAGVLEEGRLGRFSVPL